MANAPSHHGTPPPQTLAKLVRSLLPGVFLFGSCIGTGNGTTMAEAGADFGMALRRRALLSCLVTYDSRAPRPPRQADSRPGGLRARAPGVKAGIPLQ